MAGIQRVAGKTVDIHFDANHVTTLPWSFAPEKPEQTVIIGEKNMAFFTATNHARYPVTGRAVFNVTPTQAGAYFAKIQCFLLHRADAAARADGADARHFLRRPSTAEGRRHARYPGDNAQLHILPDRRAAGARLIAQVTD